MNENSNANLNNRNSNLTVVVVTIVITALILVIIYLLFLKQDNLPVNSGNASNTIETSSKSLYHIADGEEYDVYKVENGSKEKTSQISFDYPVLDIATDNAKQINSEIRKLFSDAKGKVANSASTNGNIIEASGCDGDGSSEIPALSYYVSESEEYLSIAITTESCVYGSGDANVYSYVIDKKTNKQLSNQEILQLFNISESTFINNLNNNGYGCPANGDKLSSASEAKLFIKDKKLAFINDTCAASYIAIYGETPY